MAIHQVYYTLVFNFTHFKSSNTDSEPFFILLQGQRSLVQICCARTYCSDKDLALFQNLVLT